MWTREPVLSDSPVAFARIYRVLPLLEGVTAPVEEPKQEQVPAVASETEEPWRVILFNDAVHSFEEVISQVMKATGCGSTDAEQIAWTAHTNGKALAFLGGFEDCFRVQRVLREIELVTEIEG